MLKKCKICGETLGNDRKSGFFWCPKCKELREEYDLRYKICVFGKNTGKEVGVNNFVKKIATYLELLGHEVIQIRFGELYDYMQMYELTECFVNKKPISLRFIYYTHNPDFIIVEQTYNRFNIDDVQCPVIYIHREYTHFPDILNPDMLLGSYPRRLEVFEFYHPWEYSQIKYSDELFVAVDEKIFDPTKEKIIKGVTMIGWATNPYNFANANGPLARMVIEDQVSFYQDCLKKGYITYILGGKFLRYKGLLETCEAVLIDGGHINFFGRRLFEAMASKTLCIVRLHGVQARDKYNEMGLTDDMAHFIYNPDDLKNILENWDEEENRKKVEKAYKWVLENHTYSIRAKQLLEKFKEFKNGMHKSPRYMGYAKHADIQIIEGKLVHQETI